MLVSQNTDISEPTQTPSRLSQFGYWLLRQSARLPYPLMMSVGRFIGRRMLQMDADRSRVAAINLDLCFPELSPQQHRELLQQHFESAGMGIMEKALCWWSDQHKLDPLVSFKGAENLKQALKHNKGVIFVTGQFTTQEVLLHSLAKITPTLAVCRASTNPVKEQANNSNRSHMLDKLLSFENVPVILESLKQNKAVLLSPDLLLGDRQAIFCDFFGIPALSNTSPTRLSKMSKATLLPVVIKRLPLDQGYQLVIESPLPDFPGKDLQHDSQRLNDIIERWAKEEPEQYSWYYRRFKDRPNDEPRFY